jgi:hypothetical protein
MRRVHVTTTNTDNKTHQHQPYNEHSQRTHTGQTHEGGGLTYCTLTTQPLTTPCSTVQHARTQPRTSTHMITRNKQIQHTPHNTPIPPPTHNEHTHTTNTHRQTHEGGRLTNCTQRAPSSTNSAAKHRSVVSG